MANVNPPKKNQAWSVDIGLQNMIVARSFKANPTLAAGDFLLYIDDVLSTLGAGGTGRLITLPVVVGTTPVVNLSLSATEMNGDKITVTCIDQTSPKEWADALICVLTTA